MTGTFEHPKLIEHYAFSPDADISFLGPDAVFMMELNPKMFEVVRIDKPEPVAPVKLTETVKVDMPPVDIDAVTFVEDGIERTHSEPLTAEDMLKDEGPKSEITGDGADGMEELGEVQEIITPAIVEGGPETKDPSFVLDPIPGSDKELTNEPAPGGVEVFPGHQDLLQMTEELLRKYAKDTFAYDFPEDVHRPAMIKEIKRLIALKTTPVEG